MAKKTPNSLLEKLSIVVAVLLLVAIAAFFVSYFYKSYEVTREPSYADNLPVKGEFASIEKIETHWKEDPTTRTIFPYVTITLASDSTSGSLRALFCKNKSLNDLDQTVVGDPHTLNFQQGKFDNGTNTTTIKCSQGLPDLANYLGYKDQDTYRWTIRIRESSDAQQGSTSFSALAHAPIEPKLVEEDA
ncbi:hypothetical protein ACFPK9_03790 [Rubritalea spongiae]|uniref:Uncharacterized protein n=1 Tax=Rubritalea spongiae TaxID=430797 RepID=A0ABW5E4J9_9BACT